MELHELADKLAPIIAQKLLTIPRVWGDPNRVVLGKNVVVNNALFNTTSGTISIEDDVSFGHNVCLLTGTHDITKKAGERMLAYPVEGRNIIIRKGVWLASNVTILGPCEIGENAAVAANSLVMEDIPPNCLFAGSPARFIKEIDFP